MFKKFQKIEFSTLRAIFSRNEVCASLGSEGPLLPLQMRQIATRKATLTKKFNASTCELELTAKKSVSQNSHILNVAFWVAICLIYLPPEPPP